MKILYKQPDQDEHSTLCHYGIQHCYLKKLSIDHDHNSITKKDHHHTDFEVHIITQGNQKYEVAGEEYALEKGNYLIIYPNCPHRVIESAPWTQKFSIVFDKQINLPQNCSFGAITERIADDLAFVLNEASLKKEFSAMLIENMILEILVIIFRLSGIKENEALIRQDENEIISLAKQYIEDNIKANIHTADVSTYCHLSSKQFTRLFNKFEAISPGQYIANRRVKKIEILLSDHSLSLKQISVAMNFDNEYYFNAFFKRHYGMPPGEYRKMLGK